MFYEQLEKICKLNNITVTAATLKLGISKGTATNWKKGASPNSDVVVQFAQLFNVTTDYFLMDKELTNSYPLTEKETQLLQNYRSVPDVFKRKVDNYLEIAVFNENTYVTPLGYEASSMVSEPSFYYSACSKTVPILGTVAAGKPIEAINSPLGEIQTTSNADFALIVSGNSMYPIIKDGEYVLVKTCDSLENGEIGVFLLDNSVTCKKWFKNDKIIKLISINPAYEDYQFALSDSLNENLNFKIEGKVILDK